MRDEPGTAVAELADEWQLRDMNEALLVSSLHQHELTELAQHAEQLLKQRTGQFETLLNEAPIGIYLVDSDFRMCQLNPTALAVFGQTSDFIGRDFDEAIHILWQTAEADDIVRRFRHTLETGEPYMVSEFIEERLDRRVKEHYRWQISRIPLSEGRHGVVCYFWDISQAVLAREALRESEVEYRQLFETSREQATALADLHRRKDEFLAMLSHELRNPLAPIANAVQLLRLLPDESPLQQQARTIIERQVGQLTRLVDDLLEVSRITTGRVQLRLERVVVNGIVERAIESARPLIDRHHHEFTVSPSAEPIWLFADAARLEQVIVNLLTNAAKYTVDGGRISLAVQQECDECVLRVRDTGVGISPQLLPRVFDLFTQSERSLDRSQGGLGIGLALVQRLVELHRGRVEAYSALGQGSEFVVRLPVVLSDAPQSASTTGKAIATIGPSLRVLVVDDNLDSAQSLARLLEVYGHDVRMAHTGPTALAAASDFGPQVMLLDIGLPELDGYEVAKRIRQQSTYKNMVLVAMTGYGQDADRQQSKEAGFDHHLVKPADFGKVLQILAAVSASPSQ
jgi:PAS domain S-box-containing protein